MKLSIFTIILLLFQGTISNFVPIFQYYDETVMILILGISTIKVLKYRKINISREEILTIFLLILYLIVGIISNNINKINSCKIQYLLSAIQSSKLILTFILARICFNKIKINYKFLNKIYKFFNLVILFYVVLIIANIPFNFLFGWGKRYKIIETVSIGFSHPAELDFLALSILVIQLFLIIILNKKMKLYKLTCIQVFIIVLFTGRTKSMVFLIAYTIILFFKKIVKKINLGHVLIVGISAIFLGKERIMSEFINDDGVRGNLYQVGFKIANDFFPLGSGFGTYGTEISRKFYSSLYYYYGLNTKYGLSPDWPAFITDAHWASILGETGWFGVIVYALIILLLTNLIIKYKKDTKIIIAISGLWIYGILSSFSDTILISYRGVAIAIITAFFMRTFESYKQDLSYQESKIL
ncbi:hypothetical protein FDB37_14605 [Clostridium botulinum]|nr:hypothetical protein [Clostridium botulinum]